MQHFSKQTALITGAASGIGLACARHAASLGMRLILLDVEAQALQYAVSTLGTSSVLAHYVVDVADDVAMTHCAHAVLEQYGAPNVLFNNAGVVLHGFIWEHSAADWQWLLGVNLWGVINGVRLFVPAMLQAAENDSNWQGHIVNTASMAGLVNTPNMGPYNVSKHAVVAFTESLYHDLRLAASTIGVSVLCPYFIPTAIDQSARNKPQTDTVAGAKPTASQIVGDEMNRLAVRKAKISAEDIARQVFLALARNQYYIFSHPQALDSLHTRFDGILRQTNPVDAFSQKPELGVQLKDKLRALNTK